MTTATDAKTGVSLAAKLTAAAADPSEIDFSGLLKETKAALELNDLAMARLANVSVPTVSRWIEGTSSPAAIVRRSILLAFVKVAEEAKDPVGGTVEA